MAQFTWIEDVVFPIAKLCGWLALSFVVSAWLVPILCNPCTGGVH